MKRVGKKVLAAAAATLRPVKQRKCGHTAARPAIDCEYCRKQDYYIKRRRKKVPNRKIVLTPSEAASILASQQGPSTKKRACGHTASNSDPKCKDCQAADALLARVKAHYKRTRDPNFVPGSIPVGPKIKKNYHSGHCSPEALCSVCWEREYNREWRVSQGNPELLEQLKERAAQRRAALKELRRKGLLKKRARRSKELAQ